MISSSYKLHRQETANTFDLEPSGWQRIPMLVCAYLKRMTRSASQDSFSTP